MVAVKYTGRNCLIFHTGESRYPAPYVYLISSVARNIFGVIIVGQLREFKRGVEPL
jgi:hypothetical protein